MSKVKELGACQALINSIKTRQDSSVAITLEINPNDTELVNKLMRCYLDNDRLVTVAFIQELTDG